MEQVDKFLDSSYPHGFHSDIESDVFPKGLSEETVRALSKKKNEPSFMLEFRLKAYQALMQMKPPTWGKVTFDPIDLQAMSYYAAPKKKPQLSSLDEVDPEILKTFDRLGIPLQEQKRISGVAVDVVMDSVSIGTTFQKELQDAGVVLMSFSEALHQYPDLIKKHLATVVPIKDNYFAALNSAVFSDGSFVYVPKGVTCPLELSTYFRINEKETGQFERTLIIAEEGSSVSYLEGCTAPAYDNNQLHAAVVELVAKPKSSIKYSTVQNWYAGDKETGKGGIYNFVTKRGVCHNKAKITWAQVEVGAAITWKYPSCILKGDDSIGEFYSVALTNGKMQADTGTKMIHIGKNTKSVIISKGISADQSHNTYRGKVYMGKNAKNSRNFTQCDSLLIGSESTAHTYPIIESHQKNTEVEHEASTSKWNEEQLIYLQSRGIDREQAVEMVLGGFCDAVIKELPLEFAQEARQLLGLKLEGSVG